MINFWYLFAAYMAIWVAIGCYTLLMGKKQVKISREVDRLKALSIRYFTDNQDEAE